MFWVAPLAISGNQSAESDVQRDVVARGVVRLPNLSVRDPRVALTILEERRHVLASGRRPGLALHRRRPLIPDFLLKDKREGRFVTAVPAIGWDQQAGLTLGVVGFLFDNGKKDDPFFRTTPYRQEISVTALGTLNGLQRYGASLDHPNIFDSPYRLRAAVAVRDRPAEQLLRHRACVDAGFQLSRRAGKVLRHLRRLPERPAPGSQRLCLHEVRSLRVAPDRLRCGGGA